MVYTSYFSYRYRPDVLDWAMVDEKHWARWEGLPVVDVIFSYFLFSGTVTLPSPVLSSILVFHAYLMWRMWYLTILLTVSLSLLT